MCAFHSKGLVKCIWSRKYSVSILYILVYPWRFQSTHSAGMIVYTENIVYSLEAYHKSYIVLEPLTCIEKETFKYVKLMGHLK